MFMNLISTIRLVFGQRRLSFGNLLADTAVVTINLFTCVCKGRRIFTGLELVHRIII